MDRRWAPARASALGLLLAACAAPRPEAAPAPALESVAALPLPPPARPATSRARPDVADDAVTRLGGRRGERAAHPHPPPRAHISVVEPERAPVWGCVDACTPEEVQRAIEQAERHLRERRARERGAAGG